MFTRGLATAPTNRFTTHGPYPMSSCDASNCGLPEDKSKPV
jgi:hypothetical protein